MYSIREGRTRSASGRSLTNSIYSPPFVLQAKTIMSQAENDVNVTVTIGDVKVEFSGSTETVTASVMNFLLKQVPSMDLGRLQDNSMQVSDIHTATALNPKSISSRISEMVKVGHVARDEKEPSKYRITTAGIHWLNSTIPKKIRPAQ